MSEASATLHEPFENPVRQREGLVFGMWIFLASEVLLFGGLFMAYFVSRHAHPDAFDQAGRETDLLFGTLNTALLMTSSFSLSVASRAIDKHKARLTEIGVWVTFALGLVFLAVKGLEYHKDLHDHLWPNLDFKLHDPAARLFFGLYWLMTGVHAVHISIGLLCIARLGWFARRGVLAAHNDSVEATTLYWHLVDVIWTMLYPCLYLVGR